MHGKYGDDAMSHKFVALDDIDGFESLDAIKKYDFAIRRIAERAPLRICDSERVCGSATLGFAICHSIPAFYDGKPVFPSVSHLTIRYDRIIREGLVSYEKEVSERLNSGSYDDEHRAFLESLASTIESFKIWHKRYLDATEITRPDLHRLLETVPLYPAKSFHEAVQALWFTFAFVRLCGNWPGIGRLDVILGDYLRHDLENGIIDKNEAREILASMFIKGCEWIQSDTPPGTGDAQHYQNIVLGGIDVNGNDVANDVTYLVLDIVEELGISDFPITLRLSSRTSPELLRKAAMVIRHGGGVVAVYNEDLILKAMANEGYPYEEAVNFANDGCWEVQVPGKTDFSYKPFDALALFNKAVGLDTGKPKSDYGSIEEIYADFKKELRSYIEAIFDDKVRNPTYVKDGKFRTVNPLISTVISLFEDDCIKKAQPYHDYGPRYKVRSPHIGGAPDVANSLYAIQKAVFDDKIVTLPELFSMMVNDWDGNETMRLHMKNHYVYYGNDNDEADVWMARVLDDFADIVKETEDKSYPVKFIPGVSTFGRQIEWAPSRMSTAFGSRKGEYLAPNASPTPGTDLVGATSVIRSYCKADLVKQSCGAALDIKIHPASLDGENGLVALIALMKGFVALGGFFMQIDSVDTKTLLDAIAHPEQYKTLSVRVSGWNARFVTLNREWQNMIIQRTSYAN